ncbi:MAG: conjugative transfer signal peptidase TraF [Alphaproteobacteria bacterium]|nr:conjugative transfer signal peptidase TraF [Alphaproteobacteria bacterium]
MNRPAATGLAIGLAISGLLLVGAGHAGYRINTTSSMPRGVWRVASAPARLARGMIVIACQPAGAIAQTALRRGYVDPGTCASGLEPLLKPIAAVAGDVVQITAMGILVNGFLLPRSTGLLHDSAGRSLQPAPPGKYEVGPRQVWLVAPMAASFDSRYFGAVPVSAIQGIARPVWVFE